MLDDVGATLRQSLGTRSWNAIIDFGDLGMILPAFAAVLVGLALQSRTRAVLAWALAFLVCAAATALLKNVFGGFPSGHTSMSTVFYGGMALLAWRSSMIGRLTAAGLLALIGLVAAAVLVLRWHPPIDVVAGFALGSALAWLALRKISLSPRGLLPLLAGAVVMAWAFHGTRLDVSFATRL
jgi:membrane-associated phospholipid phosphatase